MFPVTLGILVLVHAIWLAVPTIGIDTELFMQGGLFDFMVESGRFGMAFFEKLWNNKFFNPVTDYILGMCLLGLSVILWCYVLCRFSNKFESKTIE
jgi:hypothetical protein